MLDARIGTGVFTGKGWAGCFHPSGMVPRDSLSFCATKFRTVEPAAMVNAHDGGYRARARDRVVCRAHLIYQVDYCSAFQAGQFAPGQVVEFRVENGAAGSISAMTATRYTAVSWRVRASRIDTP